MKKMINTEHFEGRLYQYSLALAKVENKESPNYGKDFIRGSVDVATDDAGLNIITVNYTYVAEFTNKQQKNKTFAALKKIIDEGKTWLADGPDAAMKVSIDTSLALNDFYAADGTLVSQKRNEGGFISIVNDLAPAEARNKFSVDAFLTSATIVEADEDRGIEQPYLMLRGAVFNFRNDLLPVDFVVRHPQGIKYFEDFNITNSNPLFTKIWGNVVSTTVVTETKEESAFGEAAVRRTERKTKEWVVTGTATESYDFGGEVLTAEEVTKAMQDREIHLAEVKQKNEDFKAQRAMKAATNFGSGSAMNMPTGGADIPEVKKGNFSF